MGYLFANTTFNRKEDKLIRNFLKSELNVTTTDIRLSIDSYGLYRKTNNIYKHVDTTKRIPLRSDIIFGVEIVVKNTKKAKKTKKDQELKSALKVKWTMPESRDKHKNLRPFQDFMYFPKINHHHHLIYTLSDEQRVFEGEWVLEIFDLNNKRLASKTFQIRKKG